MYKHFPERNFYPEQRARALAMFLDISDGRIRDINDRTFEFGGHNYLVLTNEEADEMENLSLENYIDDVIFPTLPASVHPYFDREKWKDEARYAGRGQSLAAWDGEEHEITMGWDNVTYYIYKS